MFLLDEFDKALARDPGRTAVVSGTLRWTRGDLDRESRRIADFLRRRIPPAEVSPKVAFLLEEPHQSVAAIVGALRAGVAYVPLNTAWPEQRLAAVLRRVRPHWIIRSGTDMLPSLVPLAELGAATYPEAAASSEAAPSFPAGSSAENPVAYVLFTSGSTGEPKGVQVPRAALDEFAREGAEAFELKGEDHGIVGFHEFTFDMSLGGLSFMLMGRGALHLVSPKASAVALIGYVEKNKITCLTAAPSTFSVLMTFKNLIKPGALDSLAVVGSGGAAISSKLVAELRPFVPNAGIFNVYGPTEATIWCAARKVLPEDLAGPDSIPVGKAFSTTEFLFDAGGGAISASPDGEAELLIAGSQLMSGYLDGDRGLETVAWRGRETTAYRTGDLFKEVEGKLFFVGRKSGFLKSSGYRVSPVEIEETFSRHPGIIECAVVGIPDPQRDNALILYYRSQAPIGETELMAFGKLKLPAYSMPHRMHLLEAFPRTDSHKTDYAALRRLALTES